MNKHTQGRWFSGTGWVGAGEIKEGRVICRIDNFPYGESEANTSLIAAAPDMLAALELICTNYCPACGCDQKNTEGCNWCATYQIGIAAIRKAKGE